LSSDNLLIRNALKHAFLSQMTIFSVSGDNSKKKILCQ
jgi:hypothetical protein